MTEAVENSVTSTESFSADVVVAKIPGSHVTPCGSDSNWQVCSPSVIEALLLRLAVAMLDCIGNPTCQRGAFALI